MEQVWQQRGCVSPNHLANWSDYERGYRVYDKQQRMILLWFKHGKRMTSTRGCKPKGKGFSFHPMTAYRKWLEGYKQEAPNA
jgi:hypothetical protein